LQTKDNLKIQKYSRLLNILHCLSLSLVVSIFRSISQHIFGQSGGDGLSKPVINFEEKILTKMNEIKSFCKGKKCNFFFCIKKSKNSSISGNFIDPKIALFFDRTNMTMGRGN